NNEGDTALNISARFANKRLVKLLVDAGDAEDYILELDYSTKF
ncbi:4931_t:CDS:1, partial [Acaulospora morrowiae]